MKKNNSQGGVEFVLEHVFWTFLTWIWYKNILFRCLDSCSFVESKLILFGTVTIACIVGIILEIKNNRNGESIFFNLVIGYGIYTVLTYFQIRKLLIIICLLIAAALSMTYTVLVMSRKINNRKYMGRIIRRRIIHVVSVTQRLMGMGLVLIMVISGINIFFGSTIMKSGVTPTAPANMNEQSLSNNIETVALLQEDTWKSMTIQERLDVLQTVANIEQRYLGLPNELNVGAANLNGGVLGYYSDKTHEIVIDMNSLLHDSSWEVLDTVCHEAYHSYQHRMVEVLNGADKSSRNLKMFRRANLYENEFDSYISGEDDFCSYYFQDCESDARDYAEEAVYDYYLQIDEYLVEKGE